MKQSVGKGVILNMMGTFIGGLIVLIGLMSFYIPGLNYGLDDYPTILFSLRLVVGGSVIIAGLKVLLHNLTRTLVIEEGFSEEGVIE